MASKLEQMLEPGEQVLWHDKPRVRDYVCLTLFCGVLGAAGIFFLELLFGAPLDHWEAVFSMLYIMALAEGPIVLDRQETLLTDKRLLRGRGPFWHYRIFNLPLCKIQKVNGLEPCSLSAPSVELADGQVVCLFGLRDNRQFAMALAATAGIPIDTEPGPLLPRARHVLDSAGATGAFLGVVAVGIGLLLLAFGTGVPAIKTAALVFLFTILPPAALGLAVGWLAGSYLALSHLRYLVPASEIRAMFELDPYSGQSLYRKADLTPWGRPVLIRLASWVYGEPVTPRPREARQASHGQ